MNAAYECKGLFLEPLRLATSVLTECIGYSGLHNKLPQTYWLKTTSRLFCLWLCTWAIWFRFLGVIFLVWTQLSSSWPGLQPWMGPQRGWPRPLSMWPLALFQAHLGVFSVGSISSPRSKATRLLDPELVQHSVHQNASQDQPRFKDWGKRQHILMGRAFATVCSLLPSTCSFQEENNPSTDQ